MKEIITSYTVRWMKIIAGFHRENANFIFTGIRSYTYIYVYMLYIYTYSLSFIKSPGWSINPSDHIARNIQFHARTVTYKKHFVTYNMPSRDTTRI